MESKRIHPRVYRTCVWPVPIAALDDSEFPAVAVDVRHTAAVLHDGGAAADPSRAALVGPLEAQHAAAGGVRAARERAGPRRSRRLRRSSAAGAPRGASFATSTLSPPRPFGVKVATSRTDAPRSTPHSHSAVCPAASATSAAGAVAPGAIEASCTPRRRGS